MTDKSAPLETGGLPELPEPVKKGAMDCEDCDGRGGDGEAHYQGAFQPPEQGPCSTCNGSGRWWVKLYTADQMRAYAASAVLASRVAPQEPSAWVTPMLYGSKVTFYKPSKPDNWHDGDDGREWYCRPLIYAAPARPALVEPADNTELLQRLEQMVTFLCGAGMLDDKSFGDRNPREPFWWRTPLRNLEKELFAALAAPAVAVDPLVAESAPETSVHQVGEPPQAAAALGQSDTGCICHGNWRAIVKEYGPLFGRKYREDRSGKVFTFFGLVHGDDDFYYGMSHEGRAQLLSCVGSIEGFGFELQGPQNSARPNDPNAREDQIRLEGDRL